MNELEQMSQILAGTTTEQPLQDKETLSLVISGDKVISSNLLDGVELHTKQPDENTIEITLRTRDDLEIKKPVHLCFGVLEQKGIQKIISHYNIGKNNKIKFLSHCMFPNAQDVTHEMQSTVNIGENSTIEYEEIHYHPEQGHITTKPIAKINLQQNAVYKTDFKITQGRVGTLNFDYEITNNDNAVCELTTKIYAKQDDDITINDKIKLEGTNSRGIAKARLVLTGQSRAQFLGEVAGEGDNSRGHIDCHEVLEEGNTQAVSVPKIIVTNPRAKITHEAAIGSIDKKQLQALMVKKLTKKQAIDIIVKGLLK